MSFVRSIIDIKFYKEIYNQAFKKSFLYFFLLAIIVYIIGGYIFAIKADSFVNTYVKEAIDILPNFSIKNGELNVGDIKQPYIFSENDSMVIIDTTDKTQIEEYKGYRTVFVLGKKNISTKSNGQIQKFGYDEILKKANITKLDKEYLNESLPRIFKLVKQVIIIGYCILFIFWFAGKFISVLVLSLIALIVNSVQNANLEYKSLLNISVYAITLSWIIKLFYKVLGLQLWFNFIPFKEFALFLVYWTAATIYVVLAVKKINEDRKNNIDIQMAEQELNQ